MIIHHVVKRVCIFYCFSFVFIFLCALRKVLWKNVFVMSFILSVSGRLQIPSSLSLVDEGKTLKIPTIQHVDFCMGQEK